MAEYRHSHKGNRVPRGQRALYDNQALRRAAVASLIPKQFTVKEIIDELDRQGIRNPKTGKPWSEFSIVQDLKVIREGYRRMVNFPPEEHRARQYAEINAVKRQAFRMNDPKTALRAIRLEMELTGTLSLPTINVNIDLGVVSEFVELLSANGVDPVVFMREAMRQITVEKQNIIELPAAST